MIAQPKNHSRMLVPATIVALAFIAVAAASTNSDYGTSTAVNTVSPTTTVAAMWRTVAASGRVEAREVGIEEALLEWKMVRRGDEFSPSTLVRTGRRGRTTLTRNASLLIVDPETELELPQVGYSGMETSVVQNSGSVLYEVDGREEPHFEVVTPYLVAGVKGTSFLVTVENDYASVTVQQGTVEVMNSRTGRMLRVHAGESVVHDIDAGEMDYFRHGVEMSREARDEVKRLDRMDARVDRGDDDSVSADDVAEWVDETGQGNAYGHGGKNRGGATETDYEDYEDDVVGTTGHGKSGRGGADDASFDNPGHDEDTTEPPDGGASRADGPGYIDDTLD
jgi:hypothetical protein